MGIVEWRKRGRHEIVELLTVLLFLAPFLVSFAIFRQYIEGACGKQPFSYGAALAGALVNALVLSKVILIGEIAKVGKSSEGKPLVVPTIHKAAIFAIFYLIVHILEGTTRRLLHGQTLLGALHSIIVPGELMAVSLVVFFAFIPFFALREIRRVTGTDEFRCLFLGRNIELERNPE